MICKCRHTYVWWLAGRRVTLHTLYFLRMVPQWVTSTFRPKERRDRIYTTYRDSQLVSFTAPVYEKHLK